MVNVDPEMPAVMDDESNDLYLIDNPGFEDTRGYLQEINCVYSIYNALNSNKNGSKAKISVKFVQVDQKKFRIFLQDSMFPNLHESEKKICCTCDHM